jgi:hypothetical protein
MNPIKTRGCVVELRVFSRGGLAKTIHAGESQLEKESPAIIAGDGFAPQGAASLQADFYQY